MKNELRIGNYVMITPYKKNDIIQLNEQEIESLYIFGNWDRIKPIPLTEEWLLKFGYIPCSIRDNHYIIKGHTIWLCNDLFMCDKNGIVLHKVHQLQNLYFALTNEELTIKQ